MRFKIQDLKFKIQDSRFKILKEITFDGFLKEYFKIKILKFVFETENIKKQN